VLIEHLPPESATMTALRNAHPESVTDEGPDPAEGRWSQPEMLLATAVDELRNLRYVYTAANAGKGKKPSPPEPIRRPGVERKRPKPKLSDAQADFLWRHINGIEQDPDSSVHFTAN
jgi:hypothetical protein